MNIRCITALTDTSSMNEADDLWWSRMFDSLCITTQLALKMSFGFTSHTNVRVLVSLDQTTWIDLYTSPRLYVARRMLLELLHDSDSTRIVNLLRCNIYILRVLERCSQAGYFRKNAKRLHCLLKVCSVCTCIFVVRFSYQTWFDAHNPADIMGGLVRNGRTLDIACRPIALVLVVNTNR